MIANIDKPLVSGARRAYHARRQAQFKLRALVGRYRQRPITADSHELERHGPRTFIDYAPTTVDVPRAVFELYRFVDNWLAWRQGYAAGELDFGQRVRESDLAELRELWDFCDPCDPRDVIRFAWRVWRRMDPAASARTRWRKLYRDYRRALDGMRGGDGRCALPYKLVTCGAEIGDFG